MVLTPETMFVGAALVLFFFWFYGIVSFYFDLRYQFVPAVRRYFRDGDNDETNNRPDPEEYL
ncbi:hypothetical protein [Halostagnicola bangensis]